MTSPEPPSAGAAQANPEADPKAVDQRLLAALLKAAERRGTTALVAGSQPPLTVVGLPELDATVALLAREDVDADTLKQRLDRLAAIPGGGALHLVLVGGGPTDAQLLEAADRDAHHRNRLGVHHVGDDGQLRRIAGRRLPLIAQAVKLLPRTAALSPDAVAAAASWARRAEDEAAAFAGQLAKRQPRATWVLAGAIVGYFLLSRLWGGKDPATFMEVKLNMGGNVGVLVRDGQLWRLFAHAFLHGDELHLLVNLVGLLSFGTFLEKLLGWRRYLLVYALSALGGGLASALLGRAAMSVGASGALWGLMGGALALTKLRRGLLPELMAGRLRRVLGSILLINIGVSFLPNIDIYAHFAGGLVGFAAVGFTALSRGMTAADRPEQDPRWLRVAAAMMVALLAVSLALALITGKPWVISGLFAPDAV